MIERKRSSGERDRLVGMGSGAAASIRRRRAVWFGFGGHVEKCALAVASMDREWPPRARLARGGGRRYILAHLTALKQALALWALALVGVPACASSGGSSPSGDGRTDTVSASIIGGHLDTTTKGVVALALSAHSQLGVICSGSLLAPNLVLTARHCVSQIGNGSSEAVDCVNSKFTAMYDPRNLAVSTASKPQSGSKLYAVEEIREAPGSSSVCGYDIAMLILSGSGVPASEARPLEPVLDHPPTTKQSFAAVGYGLQDPNDTQAVTAGTRMRFDTSSVKCVGAKCPLSDGVEDDEFVGYSPVCSGDSGGPAIDADGRVFGVTSRGDDQCTYALYSNVAAWADFVRSTAIAAATAGSYTPPAWATGDTSGAGTSGAGNGGSANASSTTGGRPNGGSATGSAGTTGSTMPTVDPLGSACSGDCPGTYGCYAATGTPPGVCVPPCSAAANTCPARYTCSEALGFCTPTQPTTKTTRLSGSCSVAPGTKSGTGRSAIAALLGLGVLWFGRRRRSVA